MSKKDNEEQPELEHPQPQRPLTLLQRIASFIPFTHRRATPFQRPNTAPAAPELPPTIEIPTFLEYENDPCPNDPDVYYSFPSIENRRRSSILSRPLSFLTSRKSTASTDASSRPCSSGRAGTPCFHIANPRPSSQQRRRILASATRDGISRAVAGPSRPNLDKGRGKRVSFQGLPPLHSTNPHFAGRPKSPSRPPTRRGPPKGGTEFDRLRESNALSNNRGSPPPSPPSSESPEPKAPKYSYLPISPHYRNYPYVHHREFRRYVAQEQAAGRGAALARSLELQNRRPRTTSNAKPTGRDWSRTVIYKPGARPNTPDPDGPSRPQPVPIQTRTQDPNPNHPTTPQNLNISIRPGSPINISNPLPATAPIETIQASGSVTVSDGRPVSVNLELEASDVYRMRTARARATERRNRNQQRCKDDADESGDVDGKYSSSSDGDGSWEFPSPPLETPSTVGGTRMEIRGGDARYTGFDAYDEYGAYEWCEERCEEEVCWDWTSDSASRSSDSSSSSSSLRAQQGSTRPMQPHPQLTIHNPCRDASGNAHLCGGAGSHERFYPRKLENRDSVPSALFYLAGGKGAPPSVRVWRMQRPENRIGGLLGMAVFGERDGLPYELRERRRGRRPTGDQGARGGDVVPAPSLRTRRLRAAGMR
ncbi:hypothetical protein BDV96DRAFT_601816 [Lophiotrema nucula]|uniref:Uncharacterized protein n=1 Tax=Lophiotrema nucula TaxID=690887 RepID=A0A6A5Z0S6_9PLEO|nr:hypothetical protein BDV96DRAFT_601816 [Lophiotrema nucula]